MAANHNAASPFPSGGLFDPRVALNFPTGGTRPLCPYPQTPRYIGSGMTNNASNFICIKHDDRLADDGDDDDGQGNHNDDQ